MNSPHFGAIIAVCGTLSALIIGQWFTSYRERKAREYTAKVDLFCKPVYEFITMELVAIGHIHAKSREKAMPPYPEVYQKWSEQREAVFARAKAIPDKALGDKIAEFEFRRIKAMNRVERHKRTRVDDKGQTIPTEENRDLVFDFWNESKELADQILRETYQYVAK